MVRLYPAGIGHFKNVVDPATFFEIEDARHPIAHRAFDPVCRMQICPDRAPAYMPFGFRVYCFCSFACAPPSLAHPTPIIMTEIMTSSVWAPACG